MERELAHLTGRQQRERDYHREHAKLHADLLNRPMSYEVLQPKARRWWNAYWEMFAFLKGCSIAGKKALVVGCGFGDDALRLAKLGAQVYAFDLSPDALSIARDLAAREGLSIDFRELPSEQLNYESNFFDLVLARDILHHVDIPATMGEIVRVSKNDTLFLVNEVYSHSLTEKIRRSALVEKHVYARMQNFIYQAQKPYITEDERKLSEEDLALITKPIARVELRKYFNFLVTRLIPDSYPLLSKLDRLLLIILSPVAGWLAGRVLIAGAIRKPPAGEASMAK